MKRQRTLAQIASEIKKRIETLEDIHNRVSKSFAEN